MLNRTLLVTVAIAALATAWPLDSARALGGSNLGGNNGSSLETVTALQPVRVILPDGVELIFR